MHRMRVGQEPEVIDDLLWRCTLAAHAATLCCLKATAKTHINTLMSHETRSPIDNKRGFDVGGRYKVADKDTQVDVDIDMLYGSNDHAVNLITSALTFDRNQVIVRGYARVFSEQLRSNLALGFNQGQSLQAVDNRSPSQAFVTVFKQCQI